MMNLQDFLCEQLVQIEAAGLRRTRTLLEGPQATEVIVAGRRLTSFSSNDYLGLASHPQVVRALQQGADRFGAGAGASHLISGHSHAHHALEEELADFLGRERALLFSSGYLANLGVISSLTGRGDRVLHDRLNHASLLDGARLSGAQLHRYVHRDPASLRAKLDGFAGGRALIVTDGVFSMDGDLAPLPELVRVAQDRHGWLMVDDAHGLGVLGPTGAGLLEHMAITPTAVPILIGTLGKAFGTFGAFVAGSRELIEFLIQRARTYMFTTALPPAIADATRQSLILVRKESWRRDRLADLIARFRQGARTLGLDLLDSFTPIQPVVLGSNAAVISASQQLQAAGFLISAIRPPTVAPGTARLRVTLTANHTDHQVDRLLDALAHLELSP